MPDLVTVVVPVRDEERMIATCLASLQAQVYRDLEILVVDARSTDRTREIVGGISERDPRVRLLDNPQRIVSAALNIALEEARSRWYVRVDAHATVPPDYVGRAVAHLRTGQWGGVGGRKDAVGVTPQGRAIAAAMGSRFGVGGSTYHHGTSLREVEHIPFGAYPVDVARAVGGWDEAVPVNEDFEFDQRVRGAGHRLLFDPALVIQWYCRQTVRDFFRQYRRYGRGKAQVTRLHPASVRPRHLAAPALLASWAAALALAPRRPALATLLVAPYPLAIAAGSKVVAGELADTEASRHLPAAFAAMHVGWGLGFWEGMAGVDPQRLAGPGPLERTHA